ncbi:MAG: oligosaccharide flippase family protein, partial [Aristaeellaceae bacterium]
MARSLKQQAMILTLGNGVTRGLGFALHLIFARLMGAEALGVMEMAHSVGMLALTPVTAGTSAAMSRVTARHPAVDQPNVLRAGLRLNGRIALITMPVLLVCSPLLAWLLGDPRTLPAILAGIPAVALLGQCSVYSGYCCGRQDTLTPALNECTEQTVRFLLSAAL